MEKGEGLIGLNLSYHIESSRYDAIWKEHLFGLDVTNSPARWECGFVIWKVGSYAT